MKDQMITVLEALRLAKAELKTHEARRVKNAPRTIKRLKEVLLNDDVGRALGLLTPSVGAPSVVPHQEGGHPEENEQDGLTSDELPSHDLREKGVCRGGDSVIKSTTKGR